MVIMTQTQKAETFRHLWTNVVPPRTGQQDLIYKELTFLPDTIYKLEQIPRHLRPSVGKGMVFADDNQYLNDGAHAIMSTSGQPVALYQQYIITGLKCDERVHARNLNERSLSMAIGTTHMAMALPTYARSDRNGIVHDMVVDVSGFDMETGTVLPKVVSLSITSSPSLMSMAMSFLL